MAESSDPGTPTPSSGSAPAPAPGFGVGSWLPWVGLVVVGAIVGSVLGVTGVAGRPVLNQTSANTGILIGLNVAARSCPGGPVVAELSPGSRVVALARSADGSSVQVRNPIDTRSRVWVPTGELTSDSGEATVASLPVGAACPTVTVPALNAVAPVAPPAPPAPGKPTKPVKPGQPAPPADTTKPTEGKPTALVENCRTTITVTASDNVGVTSVSLSWSGTNTGSGSMNSIGGGQWQKVFLTGMHDGSTTFVTVAHDAAGNASSANSVTAFLQCLI